MDSNIWRLEVEMAMMLSLYRLYDDRCFLRGDGVLSAYVYLGDYLCDVTYLDVDLVRNLGCLMPHTYICEFAFSHILFHTPCVK